jgi:ElaB/YqjD/DUF883 family membrane-anchored ribosome-binding protein
MGSRPDEIRNEIEQTRDELAYDVDRLADRTSPGRVVGRKVEGVKEKARGMAEKVMGAKDSASDAASSAGSMAADGAQTVAARAGDAASAAGGAVSRAGDKIQTAVRQTPDAVVSRARGNPVAAGMIAFGVGLLVASLLPETEAEKWAGGAVADRSEGLVEQIKATGREVAHDLSGSAREAADSVKETAKEAANNTAEQAKESGRTTARETRQAASS